MASAIILICFSVDQGFLSIRRVKEKGAHDSSRMKCAELLGYQGILLVEIPGNSSWYWPSSNYYNTNITNG